MVRTQSAGSAIAALALVASLLTAKTARAIYLDEEQNFNLRARIYSQASIRVNDSSTDTFPTTKEGQLVQHRNFFNPELDAKLTPYTTWMKNSFLSFMAPDDLRFRVAGWGFYDGVYDYGASQFGRNAALVNQDFGSFSGGVCSNEFTRSCSSNADCVAPGVCQPGGGWFMEGPTINDPKNCPGDPSACLVDSLDDFIPGAQLKNPRDIYSTQRRLNELYLSYSKGPLFFRIGKQSISWGEADTIALLDQNNPFDITLGAPGLFQDLDEARIPLWTVRTSFNLFETLGPLSSGFVEAYWVPGDIDINTGILPILTASPYSPRGRNPQFSSGFPNATHQFILLDHIPQKRFENSRYGFRFQTVLNRFFTVQAWLYTHFPQAPVPRHAAPVVVKGGSAGARTQSPGLCTASFPAGCSPLFLVETVHDLTTVYGLATTFFVEPLDGIIRIEGEFFENEPGFIPQYNLNIKDPNNPNEVGIPGAGPATHPGTVPVSDILRWEIGFDRFFFFRLLNPTNSIILSTSNVGAYNLDETSLKDFRANGQRKPGTDVLGVDPVPDDFVQQKKVESFFQITFLTDYLHGRLTPQVTYIQNVRGTYAFHPQLTYRWTDWLLFRLDYVHIGGEYQSFGFFRDRDQIGIRATYQLN